MQQELADRTWLAADHATIADIAMYSYIRVVDEGDFDLAPYPAVLRWLEDVEKLDGFEPVVRAEE
jgi:glutathione S-transferase